MCLDCCLQILTQEWALTASSFPSSLTKPKHSWCWVKTIQKFNPEFRCHFLWWRAQKDENSSPGKLADSLWLSEENSFFFLGAGGGGKDNQTKTHTTQHFPLRSLKENTQTEYTGSQTRWRRSSFWSINKQVINYCSNCCLLSMEERLFSSSSIRNGFVLTKMSDKVTELAPSTPIQSQS